MHAEGEAIWGKLSRSTRGYLGVLDDLKGGGYIVVLSISKSVEPNEEQKEMTSSFQ